MGFTEKPTKLFKKHKYGKKKCPWNKIKHLTEMLDPEITASYRAML